jgi:hypothetical protein
MTEWRETGPFEAYNSPWKLILLFALSLGFVATGAWMAGLFGEVPHSRRLGSTTPYWGWITIGLFGFGTTVMLKRISYSGPFLRVDERGIWKTGIPSDHFVAWSEIEKIDCIRVNRNRFVGISLKDRSKIASNWWRSILVGINERTTGFQGSYTTTGTDRSFDELVEAIERFRPK